MNFKENNGVLKLLFLKIIKLMIRGAANDFNNDVLVLSPADAFQKI